jgi:hypothetical protein
MRYAPETSRHSAPAVGTNAPLELLAFPLGRAGATIVPASHERDWMSGEMQRRPYRCLPLSMANSSGWEILNEQDFTATWDGGPAVGATKLLFALRAEQGDYHAASVFGHGIVTFFIPFLFRSPPGYNLLVRGPANVPKDGASALEGIVETDWAVATFTMNWQLTRARAVVRFEADEPICMVVPQRRGELARFRPEIRPLAWDEPLATAHSAWLTSRTRFLRTLNRELSDGQDGDGWQRHYFQGRTTTGQGAPYHETKLRLAPFRTVDL